MNKKINFMLLGVAIFSTTLLGENLATSEFGLNGNKDTLGVTYRTKSMRAKNSEKSKKIFGELIYDEEITSLSGRFEILSQIKTVPNLEFRYGIGLTYFDVDGREKVSSLIPFNASFLYLFPNKNKNIPALSLNTDIEYSPTLFSSFSSLSSYSKASVEVNMKIIQNAKIFSGYRTIYAKYKGDIDKYTKDEFYFGFKVLF